MMTQYQTSPIATGERAGIERFSVSLAGIAIAVESGDAGLKLTVEGSIKKFLVEEADPDVRVSVALRDLRGVVSGEKVFDSGSIWQLYADRETYLFRLAAPFSGWQPYRVGRFNRDFTRGEILCERRLYPSAKAICPFEYPLDELLVTSLLARGRGAELHACGLTDTSGNGYIFVGQSGAGKTTTARLWLRQSGVEVLSDDRIIVRRLGEKFFMYGTPWHGEAELASNGRAPLAGIFFLRQWPRNELIEMRPAQSAARLFACSFPPFYSPDGVGFTLGFFEDLVKTVPSRELRFLPDRGAVELVRKNTA
jgi:hypothetical protein